MLMPSLALLSSSSFLMLGLLTDMAVWLICSRCRCSPSSCLSASSWSPRWLRSCTSGLPSFTRFALQTLPPSANRLMRGRRDGDPLDVESGLCISVDEEDEKQGLEEGNKYNCSTKLLFFFSFPHGGVCHSRRWCLNAYFERTSCFQRVLKLLCWLGAFLRF